ncbi:MAG: BatD family protein [Nitrospirota bacterium]
MRRLLVISCQLSVFIISLFLLLQVSFAQEIRFEAGVDRNTVSLGQSVQLSLTFHDTQDIPAPELNKIEGFKSRYVGPSSRMSIINGKVSSSISHIYSLLPIKTGRFQIGPISFSYKGNTYKSNSVVIEVVDSPSPQIPHSQSSNQKAIDLKDRVFLVIKPEKKKAYINENIRLIIKLYIYNVTIKDIEYPEFEHDGFSVGEFGKPKEYQEIVGGMPYNVLEFDTEIFGTRPGKFKLGPAKIKCNLIVKKGRRRSLPSIFDDFDDFFGRYEAYPLDLTSSDIPITIKSLPTENRPEDFAGAVGRYDLHITASPKKIEAGDPVTLKITITGKGNLNTVSFPHIDIKDGFKTYKPQIKQNRNKKVFEQVIIPKKETIKEVPEVSFSFFDPEKERYYTLAKGPIPIVVTKPDREESVEIVEMPKGSVVPVKKEILGKDIVYIKTSIGRVKRRGDYLYKNSIFWFIQVIPLFAVVSLSLVQRKRRKIKSDVRYAKSLIAYKKAAKGIKKAGQLLYEENREEFYHLIFKIIQEYIGDKFHLVSQGITMGVIDETLRRSQDINEDILSRIKEIFTECDMARYAPSGFTKGKMEDTLKKLKEVIEYLERKG